ncbi:Short-chain dehydrogenase/reductase [Cladobotryum mycophilum]|uniref:Short-chain dehydrogenase/reductase n=1 Tax=Cladobotryum mycophilum TaxID=491253 RepID=A0ABR0SU50_9HYPO
MTSPINILITGGNRGIGFGIVQAIAPRIPSTIIIIGCRTLASGQEAIDKLRELGVKSDLDLVQIDIEDIKSIEASVAAIDQKYGKLDVLINNAAQLAPPKSQALEDLKESSNKIFNNCVTSNILVTTAFVPLLRKSAYPRVLMNSSARGSITRTANRELPAIPIINYAVSKAALNMLTLHFQLQEDGTQSEAERITFWTVNPGHTKTAFNGFNGPKDPVDSAEAFVRLLEAERGGITPGTFWEFEEGQFREVPW